MDASADSSTAPRSLNKSCSECTRRKVRCDGARPCGICSTFGRAAECVYKPRSRRQTASRSAYEQAVKRADTYADVLERLFPNMSLSDIVRAPKDELVRTLIERRPPPIGHARTPESHVTALTGANDSSIQVQRDDSTTISDVEEEGRERRWNEPAPQSQTMRVADDVNAIDLATENQRRSYLGVASMSATLNAIFKLCPCTKHHLATRRGTASGVTAISNTVSSHSRDPVSTSLAREKRCIAFYFDTVHGITPLLDEEDFRATHAAGQRQDRSWLALLNMVLALGAISSGSTSLHTHYYNQARCHMDFDCLGSGNLEILQALSLLGGYYLHYVNSPNMAYAVLGAAHRMAIALGLHRESISPQASSQSREASHRPGNIVELRRRIWWSLFCLDTWSGMTLGRPTCGRWDSGTMDTKLPTLSSLPDHLTSSLIASTQFCLIVHQIQERLAQFHRITLAEVSAYDQELQRWHDVSAVDFQASSQSVPSLKAAWQFMNDRYLNSRMTLYRCLMLYDAHDMIKTGIAVHGCELATTVGLALAEEAIETITLHWTPSCFSVWSSTWYLFQACMVPLLCAAIATKAAQLQPGASTAILDRCHVTLNKAQEQFEEIRPWMKSADRGPDVIAGLNEGLASQIRVFAAEMPDPHGIADAFHTCDDWFPEASWEALLADNEWLLDDTF